MRDEKIITHQDVIDGLHEEIAALRAELARVREALITNWAAEYARHGSSSLSGATRMATARYKREIAQEKGE